MDERALAYDGFDPQDEGLREALTSTGNGYFCTRGAAEWEDADDVHYPGTYGHGLYNRETTIMGGRPVLNEDLVNLPNWLVLKLKIEDEDAIRLGNVELLDYRHEYELGTAMVIRELRVRDRAGRETSLRSRRFASMAHSHQAAIEWTLTAENWSGSVEIVSALDGRVTNGNVARYGALEGRHLDPVSPRTFGPEIIALHVETRQSNIYVAEAARTRVFRGGDQLYVQRSLFQVEDYIQQVLRFEVQRGASVRVEKLVSFYTSRDRAINEPLTNAGKSVGALPELRGGAGAPHARVGRTVALQRHLPARRRARPAPAAAACLAHPAGLLAAHDQPRRRRPGARAQRRGLPRPRLLGRTVRLSLPHLAPARDHARAAHVSLSAPGRGAFRGARCGYSGAMFPWQSGSDGSEETQVVHLNPLSGQWDPDLSHRQRHVNAAIFYNVWHYHQATEDLDFLRDHGAEMMLEIARFWGSIAHYDADRDRYEIHGVMGPDEFHEKYPGATRAGCATTPTRTSWWRGSASRRRSCSACSPSAGATRCARRSASPTRRSRAGRT